MKLLVIVLCFFIIACQQTRTSAPSLQAWILDNQDQLKQACDTIIQEYHRDNHTGPNWLSANVAVTKHAPSVLGVLAQKAGDSTDCILVEIAFFKDRHTKMQIMLAAEDSTCLKHLQQVGLPTDSTNDFIYGKREQPLY